MLKQEVDGYVSGNLRVDRSRIELYVETTGYREGALRATTRNQKYPLILEKADKDECIGLKQKERKAKRDFKEKENDELKDSLSESLIISKQEVDENVSEDECIGLKQKERQTMRDIIENEKSELIDLLTEPLSMPKQEVDEYVIEDECIGLEQKERQTKRDIIENENSELIDLLTEPLSMPKQEVYEYVIGSKAPHDTRSGLKLTYRQQTRPSFHVLPKKKEESPSKVCQVS